MCMYICWLRLIDWHRLAKRWPLVARRRRRAAHWTARVELRATPLVSRLRCVVSPTPLPIFCVLSNKYVCVVCVCIVPTWLFGLMNRIQHHDVAAAALSGEKGGAVGGSAKRQARNADKMERVVRQHSNSTVRTDLKRFPIAGRHLSSTEWQAGRWCREQNWHLAMVLSTGIHADHTQQTRSFLGRIRFMPQLNRKQSLITRRGPKHWPRRCICTLSAPMTPFPMRIALSTCKVGSPRKDRSAPIG
jgi:hypothetical protein